MKMVLNFYHVQNRVLLFLSGVLIILILQCIISQLDRTSESQAGGKRVVLEMKTDKNWPQNVSSIARRVLVEIQESESGNCPNRGICVRAQVQCEQSSFSFFTWFFVHNRFEQFTNTFHLFLLFQS